MSEGEGIPGDTDAQGVERRQPSLGLTGDGRREDQCDSRALALSGRREVSWRGGGGSGESMPSGDALHFRREASVKHC